jgi:inosose dehydratase
VTLMFSKPTRTPNQQQVLFSRYRDHGYDGLQLKGGQYASYLGQPAKFRRDWGDDRAAVESLITMSPLDEAGTAHLRDVVGFAAAVGSVRVVFCHAHPRDGLTDDDIAGFARQLSRLGAEAAEQGVRLSLHHHYNQPVMHRPDFDVFFDAVDDGSVGLTVDTSHLAKSGVSDIAGLIRDLGPVIDNIHLKDFADGEFRLLGAGHLDFTAIFEALTAIGFAGTLCVDEESRADLIEGMEVSRAYLSTRGFVPA